MVKRGNVMERNNHSNFILLTLDGIMDWILDSLTTLAYDSEPQAITAPSLISTIHQLPQHTLSLFQPAVFTSRSLVTAPNSGDSAASRVQVLSELRLRSKKTFLHRLPYRTLSVASVVFIITRLQRSSRKHRFKQYLCCCMLIPCSRIVFTKLLLRNECYFRAFR
jgi:hypothetical protein